MLCCQNVITSTKDPRSPLSSTNSLASVKNSPTWGKETVITGSPRIPLSHLQQGLIFYKHPLVNAYRQERECELEHVSLESPDVLETLKYRNAPLYRAVNIPKPEIKADGTWTFFEHMECSFPSSSADVWESTQVQDPDGVSGAPFLCSHHFLEFP